jgi:hypothetical protein
MDNAVEDTTPVLGTPEYDAAMVAKFDASSAVEVAQRPDHVPEKFWDKEKGELRTDALLKSYGELEKGRNAKAAPVDELEEVSTEDVKPPEADPLSEAKQVVESAGLDFTAMSSEYEAAGELSAETYKALEKIGIPNDVVNSYIAGQHAVKAQWDQAGYDVAGGKDQFTKMASWASTALTPQETQELNQAFGARDTTASRMKLAVAGLRAKYEAANGRTPALLSSTGVSSNGHGYESKAQMTEDMKNPKYAKDPAFRAMVSNKLSVTTVF